MEKFSYFRGREKGITLVEIVVAIFIITLFSLIMISDFPKIMKRFALSRATYKLAQDLRRVEDLGLSGIKITDKYKVLVTGVNGYGIYINPTYTQYAIYADIGAEPLNRQRYSGIPDITDLSARCDQQDNPVNDCIIETVDISKENSSLFIATPIINTSSNNISINFSPPDPITKIDGLSAPHSEIGIVLGISTDSSITRKVFVNTSGLIRVE